MGVIIGLIALEVIKDTIVIIGVCVAHLLETD